MIFEDLSTALQNGFKQVDPLTASTRIAICKACPSQQLNSLGQCKLCLCFMSVKTKLQGMKCDAGYWK